MTYASPSSESSFSTFLLREALPGGPDDDLWATARLLDEALLLCEGSAEEVGDCGSAAVLMGLEPSSSEESPPAKASSSASRSAMLR